jgi:hypothetical protein
MDKPLVIRGVDPLAGAWRGVYFAGKLDVTSRMEYVTVAHGGGYSSTVGYTCSMPRGVNVPNGAIGFIGTPAPTTSFIKNCRFEHSAGHGIARGWAGPATDFAETNTFLDIAWCQQSFPPPTTGGCPNPAPCVTE